MIHINVCTQCRLFPFFFRPDNVFNWSAGKLILDGNAFSFMKCVWSVKIYSQTDLIIIADILSHLTAYCRTPDWISFLSFTHFFEHFNQILRKYFFSKSSEPKFTQLFHMSIFDTVFISTNKNKIRKSETEFGSKYRIFNW